MYQISSPLNSTKNASNGCGYVNTDRAGTECERYSCIYGYNFFNGVMNLEIKANSYNKRFCQRNMVRIRSSYQCLCTR